MKILQQVRILALAVFLLQVILPGSAFSQEISPSYQSDYQIGLRAFNQRNYYQAWQIFQKLASQGDERALNHVGVMAEMGLGTVRNLRLAELSYNQAATLGNIDAQTNLGVFYEEGKSGIIDYKKAANYFNLAASKGDPRAQFRLGRLYLRGYGVPKNRDKAYEYFQMSESQGYSLARQGLRQIEMEAERENNSFELR